MLEERGYKTSCLGCRIRNKNYAMIRRDCHELKNNEIEFCHECDIFPCPNLEKLDQSYRKRYRVNLIYNLKRNRKIGTEKWLKEQEKLYTSTNCSGQICLHDEEGYDCNIKINPNKNKKIII